MRGENYLLGLLWLPTYDRGNISFIHAAGSSRNIPSKMGYVMAIGF